METFSKIFNRWYPLLLISTVLASFGQMLGMYVWKDDNAVFFKFTHLNEPAGYLGLGLIGNNPYKLTVAPYWFIYKIFGTESLVPYYSLALLFYVLAAFVMYKTFSEIYSKNVGKISGLLFAAGYIASDGFTWLITSVRFSLSISLACGVLYFYNRFVRTESILYYISSLFIFFLASYYMPDRMHYFIAVVFVFLAVRSARKLTIYFAPYLFIFYKFIIQTDKRVSEPLTILKAIISGDFYYLHSFLASTATVFIPDRQFNLLAKLDSLPVSIVLILVFTLAFYFVFKRKPNSKKLTGVFLISSFAWIFLSRAISTSPHVFATFNSGLLVFMGGLILLSIFYTFLVIQVKGKKEILFLCVWVFSNLYAFTSYEPRGYYPSVTRYLAHSFAPVCVLLALSFTYLRKSKVTSFLSLFIIGWGVLNVFNSIFLQREIVLHRSVPAKKFYQDLRGYLPKLDKGDIVYLDVAPSARDYFNAAFTVSQMPEETALAWRYGLDRYDFSLVTDFDKLLQFATEQKTPVEKIHAYFYTKDTLEDTTSRVRQNLKNGAIQEVVANQTSQSLIKDKKSEIVILLSEPISSITPTKVEVEISAESIATNTIGFPITDDVDQSRNLVAIDKDLRRLALDYKKETDQARKDSEITVNNYWQDDTGVNLNDNNPQTAWRPNRVYWESQKGTITIDTGRVQDLTKLVWENAYPNSTPSLYSVEVLTPEQSWVEVARKTNSQSLTKGSIQVAEFAPVQARYVRMNLLESLNGDAPGIAEIWVVSSKFSKLPIVETESFLVNPFGFVPDQESFVDTFIKMESKGSMSVFWKNNKLEKWETSPTSQASIIYDGKPHTYVFRIPAGGTAINALKLGDIQIPGQITISKISAYNPPLNKLLP